MSDFTWRLEIVIALGASHTALLSLVAWLLSRLLKAACATGVLMPTARRRRGPNRPKGGFDGVSSKQLPEVSPDILGTQEVRESIERLAEAVPSESWRGNGSVAHHHGAGNGPAGAR